MPADFIYHDPGAPLRALKRAYGSITVWADVLNDCADEIHRSVPGLLPKRLPRPSRVSEWAGGSRTVPAWCSVGAGRLLAQSFMPRMLRSGDTEDFLGMAEAICPVYAAYLSALLAGAPHSSLERMDALVAKMMRVRFMLTDYPGKGGVLPLPQATAQVPA